MGAHIGRHGEKSQMALVKRGLAHHQHQLALFLQVDVGGADDYSRISFRNTMRIDGSIQPGDYVLLLQVRDKQAKDKQNLAARTLGLRVAAP